MLRDDYAKYQNSNRLLFCLILFWFIGYWFRQAKDGKNQIDDGRTSGISLIRLVVTCDYSRAALRHFTIWEVAANWHDAP